MFRETAGRSTNYGETEKEGSLLSVSSDSSHLLHPALASLIAWREYSPLPQRISLAMDSRLVLALTCGISRTNSASYTRPLTGDGVIIARVEKMSAAEAWSKAA
jgi:hypothetical protein